MREHLKIFTENLEINEKSITFASGIVNVMKSRQEYIDIIKEHASELQKKYGITSLSLFGSVARNEHHEGSDIDIYVTMPAKMFNYVMAAQYLEKILGNNIDLVQEHRNMRPFFKEQIKRDGINIFSAT